MGKGWRKEGCICISAGWKGRAIVRFSSFFLSFFLWWCGPSSGLSDTVWYLVITLPFLGFSVTVLALFSFGLMLAFMMSRSLCLFLSIYWWHGLFEIAESVVGFGTDLAL